MSLRHQRIHRTAFYIFGDTPLHNVKLELCCLQIVLSANHLPTNEHVCDKSSNHKVNAAINQSSGDGCFNPCLQPTGNSFA